jgi:hypothetical protein
MLKSQCLPQNHRASTPESRNTIKSNRLYQMVHTFDRDGGMNTVSTENSRRDSQ